MSYEAEITKPTDGLVSRYINRKISWRITMFIVKNELPITPNQVSIISFVIAVLCFPFYLNMNPMFGGILVQASSIIDGVDGELARVTGRVSKVGGFLDAVLDRLADVIIITGVAIYVLTYEGLDPLSTLIISFLALSGSLMVSYIHARGEATLSVHPSLIGHIRGIATRDIRLFLIFIFSIVCMLRISLILIAVLSYFYVASKLVEVLIELNRS